MIIGRMDKRITLHEPVNTDDGQGGRGKSFEPNGKRVWAEFRTPIIREAVVNGAVVAVVKQPISIRVRNDVQRGWRVVYKERKFNVLAIDQPGKETMLLTCEEVMR